MSKNSAKPKSTWATDTHLLHGNTGSELLVKPDHMTDEEWESWCANFKVGALTKE